MFLVVTWLGDLEGCGFELENSAMLQTFSSNSTPVARLPATALILHRLASRDGPKRKP